MSDNPFEAPVTSEKGPVQKRFGTKYVLGIIGSVILARILITVSETNVYIMYVLCCIASAYFITRYWRPYEHFYVFVFNFLFYALLTFERLPALARLAEYYSWGFGLTFHLPTTVIAATGYFASVLIVVLVRFAKVVKHHQDATLQFEAEQVAAATEVLKKKEEAEAEAEKEET